MNTRVEIPGTTDPQFKEMLDHIHASLEREGENEERMLTSIVAFVKASPHRERYEEIALLRNSDIRERANNGEDRQLCVEEALSRFVTSMIYGGDFD